MGGFGCFFSVLGLLFRNMTFETKAETEEGVKVWTVQRLLGRVKS